MKKLLSRFHTYFIPFHVCFSSYLYLLCLKWVFFAFLNYAFDTSAEQDPTWDPVYLYFNYTDFSTAIVESTHKGITRDTINGGDNLSPTKDTEPSSQIVLFLIISLSRETSQTGRNKCKHHSCCRFGCACVFLLQCELVCMFLTTSLPGVNE